MFKQKEMSKSFSLSDGSGHVDAMEVKEDKKDAREAGCSRNK